MYEFKNKIALITGGISASYVNLINQNKTNLIGLSELNKKSVIKFCLKQGDAIIFDSRFLHRASHITEGERKVLWLYY